jgi:hypothetical protein
MVSSDELEKQLESDPVVLELIGIRDQITDKVLKGKVSVRALRAAYAAEDEKAAMSLMGYSQTEVDQLKRRMNAIRRSLLGKYPELNMKGLGAPMPCVPCANASNRFFDNFTKVAANATTRQAQKKSTCKWAQYIVALTACTAAGPIWYWPCAYLAMCGYCNGGTVDTLCGEDATT